MYGTLETIYVVCDVCVNWCEYNSKCRLIIIIVNIWIRCNWYCIYCKLGQDSNCMQLLKNSNAVPIFPLHERFI